MLFSLFPLVYSHFHAIDGRIAAYPDRDAWGNQPLPTRKFKDCLQMNPRTPVNLKKGVNIKFPLSNPGAYHTGTCIWEIIDGSKKTEIESQAQNAMHGTRESGQYLQITIPESATCSKTCVLKYKFKALHLGPASAEDYDDCFDFTFGPGPELGSSVRPGMKNTDYGLDLSKMYYGSGPGQRSTQNPTYTEPKAQVQPQKLPQDTPQNQRKKRETPQDMIKPKRCRGGMKYSF